MNGISVAEHAARRERVLEGLSGAAGVVFAGEGGPPLLGRWTANKHFIYLTGITNEPGAAVVFDPTAPDPSKRITLLLKSRDPEREHWDGYRDPINQALKEKTGFTSIGRSGGIAGALTSAARRGRRLACLHPYSVYPGAVSSDLAAFRQVGERVPGIAIEDKTQLLIELRSIKSTDELALMQKAVDATVDGYKAAFAAIKPGVSERVVAEALENEFCKHGGEHAYNPIVGGGLNATVLHYMDNNQILQDGDLVLIDAGAAFAGYAADVTRTFPVSGRFTDEQQYLYDLVLESELAGIAASRAGTAMWEVDRAARAVFEKAGMPDCYTYGIGHGLGLDVHDALPDGVLKPGMVITIEPGLYLAEKSLGIRIEDDILITDGDPVNLTAAIPK
ncbi:aminopeptidase P N-terminal domain-containing protein [Armatimonas sp.]|uniref:aminopeptidase P N-terminal domain-containing protein n=1 Tax=Armatimonas sp. TaxID=1872638 RepID=UPI00374DA8D7